MIGLPKGHRRHKGGKRPFGLAPSDLVVAVIRTSEGLGFSEVQPASKHIWEHDAHEDGLGAVVGYRRATEHEMLTPELLRWRWPE